MSNRSDRGNTAPTSAMYASPLHKAAEHSVPGGTSNQPEELPNEDMDTEETEMAEQQNEQAQQIIETGAVTPTKGKYTIHCLTIVGQVEGHYILSPQNKTTKYEHVIPQLVAIQENPEIEGMIIILNTVGGDVEAGLAIAELISGMRKPTVSLVLGGGHSIGVPLGVSANKSFIAPSATMTIHPVRMNGVVLGVPQTLSYFDKMQERIVGFVTENSNVSPKKFRQLMMNTGELVMDMGTVLTGKQAVEVGLIDHVGGLSDAIECLYGLIEENRASRKAEENEALGSIKMENLDQVANPYQVARNQRRSPARPKNAARPRRKAVAQLGQQAAAPAATAECAKSRDVRYRHGQLTSPGDDDPHSDPVFPPYPDGGHYPDGAGTRQNAVPEAQGYSGKTPPAVNPFGHPGAAANGLAQPAAKRAKNSTKSSKKHRRKRS